MPVGEEVVVVDFSVDLAAEHDDEEQVSLMLGKSRKGDNGGNFFRAENVPCWVKNSSKDLTCSSRLRACVMQMSLKSDAKGITEISRLDESASESCKKFSNSSFSLALMQLAQHAWAEHDIGGFWVRNTIF